MNGYRNYPYSSPQTSWQAWTSPSFYNPYSKYPDIGQGLSSLLKQIQMMQQQRTQALHPPLYPSHPPQPSTLGCLGNIAMGGDLTKMLTGMGGEAGKAALNPEVMAMLFELIGAL